MQNMLKDALLIAQKDLMSRKTYLGCLILSIALVLSSFGCAATDLEGFIMPNTICWLVFPIAIGPIITVPAGSRILADETSTNMLEVLMVGGVSPLAFVIGKTLKPILWGILTSVLSFLAAQIGFTFFGNCAFVLYGFGPCFLLASLTSIIAASVFLMAFSATLSNESMYSAAAICLSIGPLLLLCNSYVALGFAAPVEALPMVVAINLAFCALGLAWALWQLRPGSSHWVTGS